MGMDVHGKRPTSEVGKYFRNNCWWWRPLADYCCAVAPSITAHCEYWQSNDGDGLGARDSKALADALQVELDNGRTSEYAAKRKKMLDAMPDEECDLCSGTGKRTDMVVANGCNKCKGTGKVRPWDTEYPFSVENVREWVAFLRDCGGFEID